MQQEQSRRKFLQITAVGAASLMGAGSSLGQEQSSQGKTGEKKELKLGLASYSLRKFKLSEALEMTSQVGLKFFALKSIHLPMSSRPERIKEVAEKVRRAGLELYGGGVIYMKDKAQVNQAFEYAKTAGMKIIIGVPNPELLPLVNKKVQEYDIKVAVHNHGPTDKIYPTPSVAYEKIKELDSRIGLCNDIGHTMRAGVDPSVSAEKYADRLLEVHMKDVTEATRNGEPIEVGRGVIDIPRFLRTLVKIDYSGVVSFEYEKDPEDPLVGLAESVGYVKGAWAAVT